MPDLLDYTRNTWFRLHYEASLYPESASQAKQDAQRAYLKMVGEQFPCGSCGSHMLQYLSTNPPDVSGRQAYEKWVYDFHHAVNLRSGKGESEHSFEEVQAYFRSRAPHTGFGGYYVKPQRDLQEHVPITPTNRKNIPVITVALLILGSFLIGGGFVYLLRKKAKPNKSASL